VNGGKMNVVSEKENKLFDRKEVVAEFDSQAGTVSRKHVLQELKKKYGDEIGSGYTSDPNTQKFVLKNARKFQDDGIFRKTWITWKKAFESGGQRKLGF